VILLFIFFPLSLRDETDDAKNAHLRALPGAAERLALCRADLLDYEALRAAVAGCHGVFHTASPVTDDPVRVTWPARPIGDGYCLLVIGGRAIKHGILQRNPRDFAYETKSLKCQDLCSFY
jgi:hypothetical protein